MARIDVSGLAGLVAIVTRSHGAAVSKEGSPCTARRRNVESAGPRVALFLPSLEGGGAERVYVQLANEFSRLGFRVDVVAAAARGPYLSEVCATVRVIDLGGSGVLKSLPALIRFLRSQRPAAVLSGLEHANIVAVLACLIARSGTRCVVSTRSVPTAFYRQDRSLRRWITLQASRLVYRFADRVIANSQAGADDLMYCLGIPQRKVSVIHNPLDLEELERCARETVDHPFLHAGSAPLILGVGSLTPVKDFETLVRAFSIVRSRRACRLAILGEGPLRPRLESLLRELGLEHEATLPGFVANPFAWMSRAGVFVSSSLTEGCPNALMQALACGAPVVSTDGPGGSAEILQGGRWGRLVPVGDSNAMADAIEAVLCAQERPRGKDRASHFALDRIAQHYLQILVPGHQQWPQAGKAGAGGEA